MWRQLYLAVCALAIGAGAAPTPEESAYFFRVWRTDDGLPPLTTKLLMEAPEGYLWVESKDGLVRFDGERATAYPGVQIGWPQGAQIAQAMADDVQGIWVKLTDSSIWRERRGEWRKYGEVNPQDAAGMLQPTRDAEGGIYLATKFGQLLRCVDASPGVREVLGPIPGFAQWIDSPGADKAVWYTRGQEAFRWHAGVIDAAPRMSPDPDGPYYFSGSDGSKWIIGQQNLWQFVDGAFRKLPSIPLDLRKGENLAGMLPAPPKGVWASTANWLFFLPTGASAWSGPFPWGTRDQQRQLTNLADVNGHHWIATNGFGLLHVTPEGKQIPERLPPELSGNRILNFIEDRERNIWAVAEGSGLVRLRARRFMVHRPGIGLNDLEVLAVAEDASGRVWAGSRAGGVDVLEHGAWRHVTLPPGDAPAAGVGSILQTEGDFLVGTIAAGVWRRACDQWEKLGEGEDRVRALIADRAGTIWMGSTKGIFAWRDSAWQPAAYAGLAPPRICAIAEDAAGRRWIASESGVWRSGESGVVEPVPASEGLPAAPAQALLAEADGTVWIGSDRGLVLWRDGHATRYSPENGLPVTRVLGVLAAGRDQLWVSSPDGLVVIDRRQFDGKIPATITAQIFTRADGLPTREASGGFQPSMWRGRNGHCWLPTHQGLVEFDPLGMPAAPPPPPVILEAATAAHEGRRTPLAIPPLRNAAGVAPVAVPVSSRRLEFQFTAPSLGAPEKVQFRWRLDGLDSSWSEPSLQRSTAYPYVPPGQYRFRVIACNGDGVWNETGASLAFIVPPLWHERPVFWLGLALVLGGFVVAALRRRYRRRIERLHLLSALDQERARIAQDIHDDLGATLTQISMWSAVAQDNVDAATADHFNLIRERSNEAVRSLDQIVWAVNPVNDTVRKFATYVCQAVGDFFRETNVACRIDLAEVVEDGPLNADVRHHLVLAAREACTNALRHAGAKEVSLHVEASPERIVIVVTDNGRGFEPAKVGQDGEGLENMKRRLAATGGRCTITSTPGQGTCVDIRWTRRAET